MCPLQTFSSQKILCEAEIEKPAALSSNFLHNDFETLRWKNLTVLCSDDNVEGHHEKIGPPIFVLPGPNISKYLDPGTKMFEIYGLPLKYFIPPTKIIIDIFCQIFQLK